MIISQIWNDFRNLSHFWKVPYCSALTICKSFSIFNNQNQKQHRQPNSLCNMRKSRPTISNWQFVYFRWPALSWLHWSSPTKHPIAFAFPSCLIAQLGGVSGELLRPNTTPDTPPILVARPNTPPIPHLARPNTPPNTPPAWPQLVSSFGTKLADPKKHQSSALHTLINQPCKMFVHPFIDIWLRNRVGLNIPPPQARLRSTARGRGWPKLGDSFHSKLQPFCLPPWFSDISTIMQTQNGGRAVAHKGKPEKVHFLNVGPPGLRTGLGPLCICLFFFWRINNVTQSLGLFEGIFFKTCDKNFHFF